ncbi:hypothetical protein SARC_00211 [Sphaeroforma arctica JP610]|uniref:non-specific serine/threonine protein kinase n=1 Tax=Sphaeroforma arctica JP610 TaxID=667725 RepID=A0A0L0GF83_9EUKA|nr:hypothetical protein SARC_00211 [Sphaeroforma arctica JP610]KNC87705.1 hypothetical protein SARC_00211 [Sphaeroforma arctica JP610]|eukprot:XP_014161607.1 hypothetical protein SARC_00211 [Sphaeroforma arctica JP610]
MDWDLDYRSTFERLHADLVKTRADARSQLTLLLDSAGDLDRFDSNTVRDNDRHVMWQEVANAVVTCVDKEATIAKKKKATADPYKNLREACELLRLVLKLSARHGYPLIPMESMEKLVSEHITPIITGEAAYGAIPVLSIYRGMLSEYILPVIDYIGTISDSDWTKMFSFFATTLRDNTSPRDRENLCKVVHALIYYEGIRLASVARYVTSCLTAFFKANCGEGLSTKLMLNAATHFCQAVALDLPGVVRKLDSYVSPNLVSLWDTRRVELKHEIVQYIRFRMRFYRPARPSQSPSPATSHRPAGSRVVPLDRHITNVVLKEIPSEDGVYKCVLRDLGEHVERTSRVHNAVPFIGRRTTTSTYSTISAYEHQCYMDMAADVLFFRAPECFFPGMSTTMYVDDMPPGKAQSQSGGTISHPAEGIELDLDLGITDFDTTLPSNSRSFAPSNALLGPVELAQELVSGDLLAIGITRALAVKFPSLSAECKIGWIRTMVEVLAKSHQTKNETERVSAAAYALEGLAMACDYRGEMVEVQTELWGKVVSELVAAYRRVASAGVGLFGEKQQVCTNNVLYSLQSIVQQRLPAAGAIAELLDQLVDMLHTAGAKPTRVSVDLVMLVIRLEGNTSAQHTGSSGDMGTNVLLSDVLALGGSSVKPKLTAWLLSALQNSPKDAQRSRRPGGEYTREAPDLTMGDAQAIGAALFALSYQNGAQFFCPEKLADGVMEGGEADGCYSYLGVTPRVERTQQHTRKYMKLCTLLPSLDRDNVRWEEKMLSLVNGMFALDEGVGVILSESPTTQMEQREQESCRLSPTVIPALETQVLETLYAAEKKGEETPMPASSSSTNERDIAIRDDSTGLPYKFGHIAILLTYTAMSVHLGGMILAPGHPLTTLLSTRMAEIVATLRLAESNPIVLEGTAKLMEMLFNIPCAHDNLEDHMHATWDGEDTCIGMIETLQTIVELSCTQLLSDVSNICLAAVRLPWDFTVVVAQDNSVEPRSKKKRRLNNGMLQAHDSFGDDSDSDTEFASSANSRMKYKAAGLVPSRVHAASRGGLALPAAGDVIREIHGKTAMIPILRTLKAVLGGVKAGGSICKSAVATDIDMALGETLTREVRDKTTLLLMPFWHALSMALPATYADHVMMGTQGFLQHWNTPPMQLYALTIISEILPEVMAAGVTRQQCASEDSAYSILVFLLDTGFNHLFNEQMLVGPERLLYLRCCGYFLAFLPISGVDISSETPGAEVIITIGEVIEAALFDSSFQLRVLAGEVLSPFLRLRSDESQVVYITAFRRDIEERLQSTVGTDRISASVLETSMHNLMLVGTRCQCVAKICFSFMLWVGHHKAPYTLVVDEILGFSLLLDYSTPEEIYAEFVPFALYDWVYKFDIILEDFPAPALGFSSFRSLSTEFISDIVALFFYKGTTNLLDRVAKLFCKQCADLLLENFPKVHAFALPQLCSEGYSDESFAELYKDIGAHRCLEIITDDPESLIVELLLTLYEPSPASDSTTATTTVDVPQPRREPHDILRAISSAFAYKWLGRSSDPVPQPPTCDSTSMLVSLSQINRLKIGAGDIKAESVRSSPGVAAVVLMKLGKKLAECNYPPTRRRLLSALSLYLNWIGSLLGNNLVYRSAVSIQLSCLQIDEFIFREECIDMLANTCAFGLEHSPDEAGRLLSLVLSALLRISHPYGAVNCKLPGSADSDVDNISMCANADTTSSGSTRVAVASRTTEKATNLIKQLLVDKSIETNTLYYTHLQRTEPLPECTHFVAANKTLRRAYGKLSLKQEIRRFIDNGRTLDAGSRLAGIKHLTQQLRERRDKLNILAATEDDDNVTVLLADLVSSLITMCRPEVPPDVQLAAGSCLGEVGCIDLRVQAFRESRLLGEHSEGSKLARAISDLQQNTLSSRNASRAVKQRSASRKSTQDIDEVSGEQTSSGLVAEQSKESIAKLKEVRSLTLLAKLTEFIADPNSLVVEAAQKSLFCLLELPEIQTAVREIESLENTEDESHIAKYLAPFQTRLFTNRRMQKYARLYKYLDEIRGSTVETLTPNSRHVGVRKLLSSLMFLPHDISMWTRVFQDSNPQQDQKSRKARVDYVVWIQSICCSLILNFGVVDKSLLSCYFVCPYKYDFCEFLLPELIYSLLKESPSPSGSRVLNSPDMYRQLSDGFRAFFKLAASKVEHTADEKKAVRAILSALDHLRRVSLPIGGRTVYGSGCDVSYWELSMSSAAASLTGRKGSGKTSRSKRNLSRASLGSVMNVDKHEVALDIDYKKVAFAAYNAGSYLSALLYLELWCGITNNPTHSATFDAMAVVDKDLPDHKRLFLHIYSAINEPDSLTGANFCLSYTTRMLAQDHQRDYLGTFSTSDLVLSDQRARLRDMHGGLGTDRMERKRVGHNPILAAMQNMGYAHVLEYYAAGLVAKHPELESEIAEYQYEAAWRLGQWDASFSLSPTPRSHPLTRLTDASSMDVDDLVTGQQKSREVLQQLTFVCLKGLADNNASVFSSAARQLHLMVVQKLGQANHENMAGTYSALAWLSSLNEMNEAHALLRATSSIGSLSSLSSPSKASIQRTVVTRTAANVDSMVKMWNKRLNCWRMNDFAFTEPVLAVRQVLLGILRVRSEFGTSVLSPSTTARRLQLVHLSEYSNLASNADRLHLARQLILEMRRLSVDVQLPVRSLQDSSNANRHNISTTTVGNTASEFSLWMLQSAEASRKEEQWETALSWLHTMRARLSKDRTDVSHHHQPLDSENGDLVALDQLTAKVALLECKWKSIFQADGPEAQITEMQRCIAEYEPVCEPESLAEAYHTLATYADGHYQSIIDMLASPEWKETQQVKVSMKQNLTLMKERLNVVTAEYKDLGRKLKIDLSKKVYTDHRREQTDWSHKFTKPVDIEYKNRLDVVHDERVLLTREMNLRSRELNYDAGTAKKVETNLNNFLGVTLQNYMRCLEISGKYDIAVFRLMSIWFSIDQNKLSLSKLYTLANSLMRKDLRKIPSFKFIPLIYQLAARLDWSDDLNNPKSVAFASILYQLVYRLCAEHPFHGLTVIYALKNSDVNSSMDKVNAAKKMLHELGKESKISHIVQDTLSLSNAYHALAKVHVPKTATTMGFDTLSENDPIMQVKQLRIPITTCPPPVDPMAVYKDIIRIHSFSKRYNLVGGLHKPKQIDCLGSDGVKYKQLVKDLDDLRQDAVMQQVFRMVNKLMVKNSDTKKRNLIVRTYNVVPLSPQTGVLEWAMQTTPLSEYLVGSGRNANNGAHQRVRPQDWHTRSVREKMSKVSDSDDRIKLNTFEECCKNFHPVFRCFFLEKFPDPMDWFDKRLQYTRSIAASSIIGYILGLGDRHPSNILIDLKTAQLIHIDLGIGFEQGKQLPMPELVPFRLTRDLIDGMGIQGVEGVFRRCCEHVMGVIRENQALLLTILDVFIHDPLHTWSLDTTKAMNMQRSNTQESAVVAPSAKSIKSKQGEEPRNTTKGHRILLRLKDKMSGREQGISYTIRGQVDHLIKEAQDPKLLSIMFAGWQAWV